MLEVNLGYFIGGVVDCLKVNREFLKESSKYVISINECDAGLMLNTMEILSKFGMQRKI